MYAFSLLCYLLLIYVMFWHLSDKNYGKITQPSRNYLKI